MEKSDLAPSPFPKFIYVTREDDSSVGGYLQVSQGSTVEEALTSIEPTLVGTYELKAVQEGRLVPVFSGEEG